MGVNIPYNIPAQVETALNVFYQNGYSAYIVGGAVRDLVMNITPSDWDIATAAKPQITEELFSAYKCVETGIKHGTVTVIIDDLPIEITTFRIESSYSDNRRPDSVDFVSDLSSDLSRRDFTCNAMAFNPQEGLVDLFGGREDIQNKLLRCVGEPEVRFHEDALRIMRALRFSSILGFEIDKDTSNAVIDCTDLLGNISAERIFSELTKLLCGVNAKEILLDYSSVFFFIMPELKPMKGCAQHHERHMYDVWEHSAASVGYIKPEPCLRLAMLLHDSGKPLVKTTDADGVDHFYGHAEISRDIAEKILLRFKASNAMRKKVSELILYHDFLPDKVSKNTYKHYITLLGFDTVKDLFNIREADVRAENPVYLEQSLLQNAAGMSILNEILTQDECLSLKDLAIDGDDLIALGFDTSPELGSVLKTLFNEVSEEIIPNEKQALTARAKELI